MTVGVCIFLTSTQISKSFMKSRNRNITKEMGRPTNHRFRQNKSRFRVDEYCEAPGSSLYKTINVRNTANGKTKGKILLCKISVLNKIRNSFIKRMLVIRKIQTKTYNVLKFSFTNTNLG